MCYDPTCKLYQGGEIHIIVGPQGEGKSATDTIEVLESIKHGEHNWVNYDVYLPKDTDKAGHLIYNPDLLHRYYIFQDIMHVENAVIRNDESNQEFYARSFAQLDDIVPKVIREVKKRHWKLKLLCQNFSDLDVVFKRQATHVYQLWRRPFNFVWKEEWKRFTRDINVDPLWEPDSGFQKVLAHFDLSRWYHMDKKTFNAYSRRELFSLREIPDKKERTRLGRERLRELKESLQKENEWDKLLDITPKPPEHGRA